MKILALDGGGSKGIYSLGILHEIEAVIGAPLKDRFDCFYGVSTGAIIAAALAQGRSVAELRQLYLENIPKVMSPLSAKKRSARLKHLLQTQFGDQTFEDFTKYVGIVSASNDEKVPKIFKTNVAQAHGRKESFKPGFGAKIWEAVYASCSATPFFETDTLNCADNSFELIDGGFAANNPTLFSLIDALKAHSCDLDDVRIVNIGTGQCKLVWQMRLQI
jgi:patatin-like phospholipase/acyl hydrolase